MMSHLEKAVVTLSIAVTLGGGIILVWITVLKLG